MSVVSSYVILASAMDDAEDGTLAKINAFFSATDTISANRAANGFQQTDGSAGGGKAMQATVYQGAFNFFDEKGFAAHLRALEWNDPDAVRVFLMSEHDEAWHEVCVQPEKYAPGSSEARVRFRCTCPEDLGEDDRLPSSPSRERTFLVSKDCRCHGYLTDIAL